MNIYFNPYMHVSFLFSGRPESLKMLYYYFFKTFKIVRIEVGPPVVAPNCAMNRSSVEIAMSVCDATSRCCITSTPFQRGRNSVHHSMSARASAFNVMRWSSFETVVDKFMSLPGLTTFAANDKVPISDRSSLCLHLFHLPHVRSCAISLLYFSVGRLIVMPIAVSICIPR